MSKLKPERWETIPPIEKVGKYKVRVIPRGVSNPILAAKA